MNSQRKGKDMAHDPDKYRDERLAVLETVIGHININLEKIDQRFDRIDQRFEKMDERFEKLEQKMDQRFQKLDDDMRFGFMKINDRMWTTFLWIISLILATSGGLFTLMAHGFHWI